MTIFFNCFCITLMFLFLWSVSVALREGVAQIKRLAQIPCSDCDFFTYGYPSNVQCDPVLLVLRKRSVLRTLNLRFVLPMLISNIALNFTKITQKYRQHFFSSPFNKGDRWVEDSPLLQWEPKLRLLIKKNTL